MQLAAIFLSDAAARAICWTLIHSLWQGILIAGLAGLIIYGTRKLPAALRYNLLAADLLLFLLVAGMTFGYEIRQEGAAGPATGSAAVLQLVPATVHMSATSQAINVLLPSAHPGSLQQANDFLNTHAFWITGIWLVCLSIQLLRVSGGLYRVGRIRRYGALPVGSPWAERMAVLAARLSIRRPIRLLQSNGVPTPSAVGWWKPVVLLPLGLLANLSQDQAETILLHELAHIRRNDYAANLVLHFAEAIFFFNPGLRWVATLLRREREACCDDIVLAGTPDRNSYLEALVSFTQWLIDERPSGGRLRTGGYAPQLGGNSTDLLWRVRRMLNQENKKLQPAEKLILSFGLMAVLSLGLVAMRPATARPAAHAMAKPAAARPEANPATVPLAATQQTDQTSALAPTGLRLNPGNLQPLIPAHPDTIPATPATSDQKSTATPAGQTPVAFQSLIIRAEKYDNLDKYHAKAVTRNGDRYEISSRDGKVTEFRLNGRLIPKTEYDRYSVILDSIESARKSAPVIPVPAAARLLPPPAPVMGQTPPASPTPVVSFAPVAPALNGVRSRQPHAPTPEDPLIYPDHQNPYAKHILQDLVKDGLAHDLNHISFVLDANHMTVDGVEQPDNIFHAYRDRYIQDPRDHMIYSQHYSPSSQSSHCECYHYPDTTGQN